MAGIAAIRKLIQQYLESMGQNPTIVEITSFETVPENLINISGEFTEFLGKTYKFDAVFNNDSELLAKFKIHKND